MKSGEFLPAIILETGEIEIKYKKTDPPDSKGIYTVFKYEVSSLHYKNGNIVDYANLGINDLVLPDRHKPDPTLTGQFIKFGFGVSGNYFRRTDSDNLNTFWRYHNDNKNLAVGGNPKYLSYNIIMNIPLGGNRRNWLAAGLQLISTPKDAIYASSRNGLNEIELKMFYYNIEMIYGRSINYKKNLLFIFEPSLDLGFMSGFIKLDSSNYKLSFNTGVGSHIAVGLDWNISKRVTANIRVGQRFLNIKESHNSLSSSTGFSRFYANPLINKDLLYIKWNGSFVSFGLSYSFYAKMPGSRK